MMSKVLGWLLDYFHLFKDTKDTCVNQLVESGSVVEFSFVCFVFCFVPVSLYVSQAFLDHKPEEILLLQFSKRWNCRCNHRAWLNWSSLHSYCVRDLCSAPFPMAVFHEELKPHWRFESGERAQSGQKPWGGGYRHISLGREDGSRFVFVRVSNSPSFSLLDGSL